MSSLWRNQGPVDIKDSKENQIGSAFSWRGKKITIVHVNHHNAATSNPFASKPSDVSKSLTAGSPQKQHPSGKELEQERSHFLNELGVKNTTAAASPPPSTTTTTTTTTTVSASNPTHDTASTSGTTSSSTTTFNTTRPTEMPPLLPSDEPRLPSSSSSSSSSTSTTTATRGGKHKKKMSVSFSEEMNETRTFERVKDKEVSKLWYSQEEARQQREEARHETKDLARIGVVDGGTQTSPMLMMQYGKRSDLPTMPRKEEVARMRGKVMTGKQQWRRGHKINHIELHNQVVMPNDPVYREIKHRGYRDDGTGRYRKY